MDHRNTPGLRDGLLLIGLDVGVISFMTIMTRLADSAASIVSFRFERIASPLAAAPDTTAHDRLGDQGGRVPVSANPRDRQDRGGQGDAAVSSGHSSQGAVVSVGQAGAGGDPNRSLDQCSGIDRQHLTS